MRRAGRRGHDWKRKDGTVVDRPLVTLPAGCTSTGRARRRADGGQVHREPLEQPGVARVQPGCGGCKRRRTATRPPSTPTVLGVRAAAARRKRVVDLLRRARNGLAADATYSDEAPKVNAKGQLAGSPTATLAVYNGFVLWANQDAGDSRSAAPEASGGPRTGDDPPVSAFTVRDRRRRCRRRAAAGQRRRSLRASLAGAAAAAAGSSGGGGGGGSSGARPFSLWT